MLTTPLRLEFHKIAKGSDMWSWPPETIMTDSRAFPELPRPGFLLLAKQSLFAGWLHSESCFHCQHLTMRLEDGNKNLLPPLLLRGNLHPQKTADNCEGPTNHQKLGTLPVPDLPSPSSHSQVKATSSHPVGTDSRATTQVTSHPNHENLPPWHTYINKMIPAQVPLSETC